MRPCLTKQVKVGVRAVVPRSPPAARELPGRLAPVNIVTQCPAQKPSPPSGRLPQALSTLEQTRDPRAGAAVHTLDSCSLGTDVPHPEPHAAAGTGSTSSGICPPSTKSPVDTWCPVCPLQVSHHHISPEDRWQARLPSLERPAHPLCRLQAARRLHPGRPCECGVHRGASLRVSPTPPHLGSQVPKPFIYILACTITLPGRAASR